MGLGGGAGGGLPWERHLQGTAAGAWGTFTNFHCHVAPPSNTRPQLTQIRKCSMT